MFTIISDEKFESIWGTINKGDIIETVMYDDFNECKKYINDKYGKKGENIKVKIQRC